MHYHHQNHHQHHQPASISHKVGDDEKQEIYQRVENPIFNKNSQNTKFEIIFIFFFFYLKATSNLWDRGEERNLHLTLLEASYMTDMTYLIMCDRLDMTDMTYMIMYDRYDIYDI